MAEETLVDGEANSGVVYLTALSLTSKLPGDFTDLGNGLRWDCFSKASEATARVDRNTPTKGGCAASEELFGFSLLADTNILVPI